MEIIADTKEFYIERETAVAIGKFDGVHLGHRRLLDEILLAKKRGLAACVFTFDPPPAVFFGRDQRVLSTLEEKRRLFEHLGVDFLIEFPMNRDTAATPPRDFVTQYLVNQLNTRFIAAGPDISFGDRGLGNALLLESMAEECGFEVRLVDKVRDSLGREISSSLVREAVQRGELESVTELLGMPYSFTGTVIHGNHLGHDLGFPTVNMRIPAEKLLPPLGVYESKVLCGEECYSGISNIGVKPTIGGEDTPLIETYIKDFSGDLYGKELTIELMSFKRPEKRFESIDELRAQLAQDCI